MGTHSYFYRESAHAHASKRRRLAGVNSPLLGLLAVAASLIVTGAAPRAQTTPITVNAPNLAPYVATPDEVVDRMLRLAKVGAEDVVYDLGSGDGRIVIAAAKSYGARGVGVDTDPQRIAESNTNATRAGVGHLVTFTLQDALATDVSPATVVTLYLLSASNLKLRPLLTRQLKPGARIVAHAFSMGDWKPTRVEAFTDATGSDRTLYLWTADGRVRP